MKYLVVEIYENGREVVTEYKDFYEAREYASTRTGCMVADVTDLEDNVLESWSCGTLASEAYMPHLQK